MEADVWSSFVHDDVVNRVCVCTVSLSKLKLSLGGHTWSTILSLTKLRCACQLPLWSPQFGKGLMHLVLFLVERLMVVRPAGVER